jgi:hypothetical protein
MNTRGENEYDKRADRKIHVVAIPTKFAAECLAGADAQLRTERHPVAAKRPTGIHLQ